MEIICFSVMTMFGQEELFAELISKQSTFEKDFCLSKESADIPPFPFLSRIG